MQATSEVMPRHSRPAVSRPAGEEATIRELTSRYMELWSGHAIAENSAMLAEDADLVNVLGQRLHGRENIHELHVNLHRTIFAGAVTRILDLYVKMFGDTAVVNAQWEMRGAAKLPGWNVPDPRTGWMTMVWVKRDGAWLITSLHNTDTIPAPSLPTT